MEELYSYYKFIEKERSRDEHESSIRAYIDLCVEWVFHKLKCCTGGTARVDISKGIFTQSKGTTCMTWLEECHIIAINDTVLPRQFI